jgi:ankyrin repeat protein
MKIMLHFLVIVIVLIAATVSFAGESGYIGPADRFFSAIKSGDITTVKKMLSYGVCLDFHDDSWQQPLHVAVAAGKKDIVSLFLSKGANANAMDSRGNAPLDYCRDATIMEALKANGAESGKFNKELFAVILQKDTKKLEQILKNRANIDKVKNHQGTTTMNFAVMTGNLDVQGQISTP